MKRKTIKNYSNYEIDEEGRVYSKVTGIEKKRYKVKGYYLVTLFDKGKKQSKLVHRIVAESFIPNPKNKRCVNHKDSNKLNNNLSNLEWMTHKENTRHAIESGTMKISGINNPKAKLTEFQVRQIRKKIKNKIPYSKIMNEYGVSKSTIVSIGSGRSWKHLK